MPGTVTLIGSGEMTESMGRVHRTVMARIAGAVNAVFLDTPAGFQLNADEISARAVEYFKRRFNVELSVASFKNRDTVTEATTRAALAVLHRANYIFAGPGSPSYAVRNLRNTLVETALVERWVAGAHIVFASAAAIALSRYTLPVYEIYKVGTAPYWAPGLDLLGRYGFNLAIVPHWNNQEGGTHDTRYAYMGAPRLKLLEKALPDTAVILGVDEHTACTIDLTKGMCQVRGAGSVTIRQQGRERVFTTDESFSADYLARGPGIAALAPAPVEVDSGPPADQTPANSGLSEAGSQDQPPGAEDELVNILIGVRAELRREAKWALADKIRRRLADIGIVIEDRPEGSSWRRV